MAFSLMPSSRRIPLDASKVLFWAFVALLVWAPIPLGSNRPWAWTLLEVYAYGLLAAWLVLWTLARVEVTEPMRRAGPAWILLIFWIALQAVHVALMPAEWIATLSPESARMHAMVADLGIKKEWMTLSVDPDASRISFFKTIAYGAVFFLTLALVNRRARVIALARVLVYAAVIHAVYAVLVHLSGVEQEYFGTLMTHASQASGTFANRNHFAGFLYMSLALGIGLLIAQLSERRADSWTKFVKLTIEWILSPKMILRLSLCILVIALTTTHSRMGNTAFFSSLLIAGGLGIVLSRKATRNTVLLLASLVVLDLFIVGSWFGVEKLAQRLDATTMENVQEREDPAAYTIPLIKDYPVFGAGPGAFYVTFPRYRPEKVAQFYDYAHNDYAQFAAESGLLGLTILGLFVAITLFVALKAQWQRRDPLMRGMSFACVMGVTAILIHSWVDFNLQIPANAMLFMVLLALGWISLYHDRSTGSDVVGILTRLENGK
jgi:putative inorganic carbon (HCO3(-)) transporter